MVAGGEVVVVGSGFGGAVAALRLVEKGYRVTVLEAGRRFADTDFADSPWQAHRILWAPRLGLTGIVRVRVRRHLLALTGIGVGGGSLAYAGVLHRPTEDAFRRAGWDRTVDWAGELAPFYALAERMLGTAQGPLPVGPDTGDGVLCQVAADPGSAGASFRSTRVGVYFGAPGRAVPDPYFAGRGPERTGCTGCARCVLGCRVGAKNTLVKNYLHLAEQLGARIRPLTTVTALTPRPGGGWHVRTVPSGTLAPRPRATTLRADHVVLAAGAWGTVELLHRCRAAGTLPGLPAALGSRTRTNREVLLAVSAPGFDVGPGVAVSSELYADGATLVQLCRVGGGSHPLAALLCPLPGGGAGALRRWPLGHFGRRTAVLLAMEARESALTSRLRHGHLVFTPDEGPGEPARLPAAEAVARDFAGRIAGSAYGWWWNTLLGLPFTAHLLGGCPIGTDPRTSVVDPGHRVHGHPTLHIADASVVPANLGCNPALTVTALAERAFSAWPVA
ncbi:FAD-dependent oxidoreductase [Streptomyces sp. NPDC046261]|uniref:FAD-dependent oxidoreductase n=1 Tax=Streptomyces sp. NPDC046261 TaxID=3157200 RepID=UPI0033C41A0E